MFKPGEVVINNNPRIFATVHESRYQALFQLYNEFIINEFYRHEHQKQKFRFYPN